MKTIILSLVLVSLVSSAAFGQEMRRKPSGPRRQLATIVFAGLGGAILGLSTLSFYGRPQEHLGNIAIGFAVGVIGGTAFVTFRSASSRSFDDEDKGNQRRNDAMTDLPEKQWLVGPLIDKPSPSAPTSLGAQFALKF